MPCTAKRLKTTHCKCIIKLSSDGGILLRMKKHRLLISGKKFYFRILCFSFTAFFTFTILFLCVSTYTNYNKTGTNIRSIENSNNERITRQFTSFLSQTTVKMSYFSQISEIESDLSDKKEIA